MRKRITGGGASLFAALGVISVFTRLACLTTLALLAGIARSDYGCGIPLDEIFPKVEKISAPLLRDNPALSPQLVDKLIRIESELRLCEEHYYGLTNEQRGNRLPSPEGQTVIRYEQARVMITRMVDSVIDGSYKENYRNHYMALWIVLRESPVQISIAPDMSCGSAHQIAKGEGCES